jgi:hypothetical protein
MARADQSVEHSVALGATLASCAMLYSAIVLAVVVLRVHAASSSLAPSLGRALLTTMFFSASGIAAAATIGRTTASMRARASLSAALTLGGVALVMESTLWHVTSGAHRLFVTAHAAQSALGAIWLGYAIVQRRDGERRASGVAAHWLFLSVVWSLAFLALWVA